MSPYRFASSQTMTSKEIDAEYEKAFLEKKKISIEKSRMDPNDQKAIRIKRITELKWERKCNWLLEDLDKKLVEENNLQQRNDQTEPQQISADDFRESQTNAAGRAREMRTLLTSLKQMSLGAPMGQGQQREVGETESDETIHTGTYTGGMRDGKRHGQGTMIYNNKDTYEGEWDNDKMNGRGEFKKNVRGTRFDWEFYGDFIDNYPIRGRVVQRPDGEPTQKDGKPGINIFDWKPYETNQRLEGGEVSAADAAVLRRNIEQHAAERISEASKRAMKNR